MLVDGSSLIYRAFFANPLEITAPGGGSVNAAHGFLGMLARLVTDYEPEWLAVATDEDWRPQWRVDLIDSYKTHRLEPESTQQQAEDLIEPQLSIIFELLERCGVAVVGVSDYEAEDVIGALVPRAPGKVAIVSGDRDLFQLVRDPKVRVLYPKRGVTEMTVVDESEIERRFGIPGRAYGDFAVLRGDPSDGLPGVRGIGDKTAAALISKYGSLERVIEAALTGDPSAALAKVAASLDYLDKAARVVFITAEAPVGEVDLRRPRGETARDLEPAASQYGLIGPVHRLISALRGSPASSSKESREQGRTAQ